MDPTRIHLFITHLPVFGLFLGVLTLLYGILRKEKSVRVVALLTIIIATAGAVIAFKTGEGAEETAEHISGITHDVIEAHEESAEVTILLFYGLGVLSVAGLYLESREVRYASRMSLLVILFSALTFYFAARTASLGGKIRHTEITGKT